MPTYNVTEIYNGRTWERDAHGINTTIVYAGDKTNCEGYANSLTVGATYDGLGKLASVTVTQAEGAIYNVTAKYANANGSATGGNSVIPPNYAFGQKSASMDGNMLSAPIEQHPSYLMNWNHYLLARYAVGGTAPASAPSWWSTATASDVIPDGYREDYQWADSGNLPMEDGYVWFVLKNPTMPGFQSYDRALYSQTESARYTTYALALSAVYNQLNHTGTPAFLPSGTPFVAGNWKCDRATVSWTGEFWIATLTWTYSPDGWNSTLYSAYP
jgi:hypothetical protein